MTLRAEVEAEAARLKPREFSVARLRGVTDHVSAWARDVEPSLRQLGLSPPNPRTGDPLLLAASDAGSLWRLPRPEDPRLKDLRPLRDHAAQVWSNTQRIAMRYLPLVTGDLGWVAPPAGLIPLGGAAAHAVDGASFGVSFLLAHASRGMGIPVDPTLAASAVVREDGSLGPVEGLGLKIAALVSYAPNIRRLILCEQQEVPEAERAALTAGGITVSRLPTALAVLDEAFPTHDDWLLERWAADPEHAQRLARALFRELVDPKPYRVSFSAIGHTARLLLAVPGIGATAAWEADVARVIADRHASAGAESIPPAPPEVHVPRRLRLMLLAHQVQAMNDRCDVDWQPTIERALETLRRGDEAYPADLMVLGAVGRCYAGWGRWDEARTCLVDAVVGWYAHDMHARASHALCELVRVEGVAGTTESLEAACAYAKAFHDDPRTSDDSRAFMVLAQLRAWATHGDTRRAAKVLEHTPTSVLSATPYTAEGIARWSARAGLAVSGAGAAAATGMTAILVRLAAGDSDAEAAFTPVQRLQWDRCKQIAPEGGVGRWLELYPY